MSKAVALLSGGMDSTVLAYHLADKGRDLHLLSFDYGQRHRKELTVASAIAALISAQHDTVVLGTTRGVPGDHKLQMLSTILKGSSLTDETVEVPDGHYAEESMKATVVPNRNAIMLSIAYGVAVAEGAKLVAFAAHAGDHAIYPDCREEFVGYLSDALQLGNEWADPVPEIKAPFITLTKAQIVKRGVDLDVPFHLTWSCYKGGKIHCGRCGTCVERKEAFQLAEIEDPTAYEDYDFMMAADG